MRSAAYNTGIMSERSREKIALLVFVALVVFGGCCLVGYIVAGHSWNVAASSLDDTFGSMDGYTTIVYAGTVEPQKAGGAADDEDAVGFAAGGVSGAGSLDAQAGSVGSEDGAPDPAPGGLPGGAGDAEGPNAGEGVASADDDEGTVSDGRGEGTAAGAKDPAGAASGSGKKDARKPVTVEDVRASYEDKNATVFSLDTTDLPHYREGVILKKGGHRFGVFSVDGRTSLMALRRQIAYFEKHEVDFVVALTPDKRLVERVADGLDIVVSTQDEALFVMGETADGTFYVDAPEKGSVGVILISLSNVVSAKVVEEL